MQLILHIFYRITGPVVAAGGLSNWTFSHHVHFIVSIFYRKNFSVHSYLANFTHMLLYHRPYCSKKSIEMGFCSHYVHFIVC